MRRIKLAGLILLVLTLVVVLTLFIIGHFKPKVAGVFIETNPPAGVFINGEQAGRTPFRDTLEPGEVIVKLVPESFDKPLSPYETRVNLIAGVETVIRYDFGESEEMSSGEIISFEKIDKNETSLVVVSIPDSAGLVVDGFQKVVTPYKTSSITAGDHTLVLKSDGFIDRQIKVKTHKGYKLTAIVQLAISSDLFRDELLPTPEVTKEPDEKVEILPTSVGFLRVRAEPSTLGREVGQVKPGKAYALLEEDEETGWYKIEFSDDEIEESTTSAKSGWISNQYAKKVEEESSTMTPTP